MKLEEAAYINLLILARADGTVTGTELAALERHRKALGLSEEFAESLKEKTDLQILGSEEIKGKPSDRLQILKMMIRVAYADGKIADAERKLLKRVARSLGVGRLALRGLYLEIEREMGMRRKLRLSQITAAAVIVLAALIVWFLFNRFSSETEHRLDEARIDLEEIKAELGLEKARAEDALRKVRESQEALARNEAALEERLIELDRKSAGERDSLKDRLTEEQQSRQDRMDQEVKRLRKELARIRSINAVFKDIEKEYDSSILLIFTTYDLVVDQNRVTRASMGTGFFISSAGHIVTNKHVVQPWKFNGDDVMLMFNGFKLDPSSLVYAAWTAGSEILMNPDMLNLDTAFTSVKNSLTVEATAPDTFVTETRRLESGGTFKGRYHTSDHSDLALLKAEPAAPVKALPLATDMDKLEKLDPVMVLGFPTGLNILETNKAETSPSLGEVRKIENSIMVTAPIFPGNSGGPLMDLAGNVVGVASGIFGDATLGSCIPSKHILSLLPPVSRLLLQVDKYEGAGAYRAALDDLRLAEQRCTDEKERESIDKIRARLFEIRERMEVQAREAKDTAARKNAYQEIVDRFGPHWGKDALERFRELQ